MKVIIFLCIAFAIYKHWPEQTVNYSESNQVVLYSTDWCGYCEKTRQFLNEKNIEYVEFDIEKSDEGLRRYNALNGNGVPVLNINGTKVTGYNKSKILNLLI